MTRGGDRGNQYTREANPKNQEMPKNPHGVADVIAREHGIGHASVTNASKFAKGIDEAEDIMPGAKEKLLSGAVSVPNTSLMALTTLTRFPLASNLRFCLTQTFMIYPNKQFERRQNHVH